MSSYNRPYRNYISDEDFDYAGELRTYRRQNSPKEVTVPTTSTPTKKKPERTPLKHVAYALGTILAVFLSVGGVVGAVVGDIEAWNHLPWLYALYITIGLASVVAGIMIYTSDV